jgi:hypothetical protein
MNSNKKRDDKIWNKCLLYGIILGFAVSLLNFYANGLCLNNFNFCWFSRIIEYLAYFPTIYIFLFNALGFVKQNTLVMIMFFIIPVLQYGMIGSIIGIFLKKFREEKNDKGNNL